MFLDPEAQPTEIDVPAGPLPHGFREALDKRLRNIIPDGKNGAALILVHVDERGRPAVQSGFATKVFDNGQTEWRVGVEFEKVLNGPASGALLVMGSW